MTILEREPPSTSHLSAERNATQDPVFSAVESLRDPIWIAANSAGSLELAENERGWFAPPCHPSAFGDPAFRLRHGIQFNYVAGAMANGIASTQVVESAANAGGMGFFGSAGLGLDRVEKAIDTLQA